MIFTILQREYEEFRVRINSLVAKSRKVPEEGWTMQDGTPWPGNNVHDHPGMIQVSNKSRVNGICVDLVKDFCIISSWIVNANSFSGFSWRKWGI